MTSRDWLSSERPPGGTETYHNNYARANVKAFPEIPNGYVKSFHSNQNHSKPSADGDQSMASATDLFKSMTINEIAEELMIFSSDGRVVYKSEDLKSNISTKFIRKGLYYIKYKFRNRQFMQKIVI